MPLIELIKMSAYNRHNNIIKYWLFSLCALIIFIIIIGGYTRLTGSGLSITEWRPVTGVILPMSDDVWIKEFDKYKQSPEFRHINFMIDLLEFKKIYITEYFHRILGRVLFLLYSLPLLYFLIKRYISTKELPRYTFALILILAQGVAGWYMVKSGLINDPHVSHFRLALHLLLAVFLYTILLWQFFKCSGEIILIPARINISFIKLVAVITILILFLQIILGAFVAGLKAGLIYNQFPLMGESIIPDEVWKNGASLYDPVFIQFIHRFGAYVVTICILLLLIKGYELRITKLNNALFMLFLVLAIQFALGVLTLIYLVPTSLAIIHQVGAVILLTTLLRVYFLLICAETELI